MTNIEAVRDFCLLRFLFSFLPPPPYHRICCHLPPGQRALSSRFVNLRDGVHCDTRYSCANVGGYVIAVRAMLLGCHAISEGGYMVYNATTERAKV
jgi:hypothetical protein